MIAWFRERARRRRDDLDARVLAEVQRLGAADELAVRRVVRVQHAVLRTSLDRLEAAGAIGSRPPGPAGGQTARRVYFVTGAGPAAG